LDDVLDANSLENSLLTTNAPHPFVWKLRVYYEDTDLGGVVYYANYLKFMERARTEWLRALGLENRELLEVEGAIFVVTQCNIQYLKAARMDDQLTVTVQQLECKRASATLTQNILLNDTLLATANVGFAYVSAADMKPKRLHQALLNYGNQSLIGSRLP
jgi:acyl-CoA thioester hydrolase